MRTIVSTADAPPRERFDYYRETVRVLGRRGEIETFDRASFYGELRAGRMIDLTVAVWRSSPVITMVKDSGVLSLVLPSSRAILECPDGHCVELNCGSLCLEDTRTPLVARPLDPSRGLLITIPPAEFSRRIRLNQAVLNRPIAAKGDAALLVAQVRALISVDPSTLSPAAAEREREHLLDLAALALSSVCGELPRLGAASRMVELRLRAAVDAQLVNPDADRGSIAAAAGVSERHADRVLAQDGRSVRSLLLERRLEKCREALEQGDDRKIYEIALQHGFTDTSHFSRAFKERFGRTPGECRPY